MLVDCRRHARTGALLAVVVLSSCTSTADPSDPDDAATSDGATPATVTVPPARLTPFCQAMIDLADELESDPPDDVAATIVDAYEGIADQVPDAVRADFDAVLADLRGNAPVGVGDTTETTTTETTTTETTTTETSTTTVAGPPVTDASGSTLPPGDPFFDELRGPEDDPAGRLSAYVDFECRNVENNPGPPPTEPLSAPTTDDG